MTAYARKGDKCHEKLSGTMSSSIDIGAVQVYFKEELEKRPLQEKKRIPPHNMWCSLMSTSS